MSIIFNISFAVFLLLFCCVCIFQLLYFTSSCISHASLITVARILLTQTERKSWGDGGSSREGLAISSDALREISGPNYWLTDASSECGILDASFYPALGSSNQFLGNGNITQDFVINTSSYLTSPKSIFHGRN